MQTFLEVACDESGWSGTNLLDIDNPVLTHASVHLDTADAAAFVSEVRARFPYSAVEYKAAQLRQPAIEWLLGPSGPLAGNAHVHLTDKTYFAVRKIVELFVGVPGYLAATSLDPDRRSGTLALTLHHDGPAAYGPERWQAFLRSFVTLLRTKRRQWLVGAHVDAFFGRVEELVAPGEVGEIMGLVRAGRARMDSLPTRLLHDPGLPPPLEPLIPALLETARYWCDRGGRVTVVHDEQSALTRNRIRQIQHLLDGRLHAVRRVDSRTDPRIQVADFLAGAARRIASAELRGEGDDDLTALLRPYVDPHSIWADNPSWSRLAPAVPAPGSLRLSPAQFAWLTLRMGTSPRLLPGRSLHPRG